MIFFTCWNKTCSYSDRRFFYPGLEQVMEKDRWIAKSEVQQVLIACQDVLGEDGFQAVLRTAGLDGWGDQVPPDDLEQEVKVSEYARLNQAIEEIYGRASRGILQRVGRVSFQNSLRQQDPLMIAARLALKLIPRKQRIKFILTSLVRALKNTDPSGKAWVGEKDNKLAYFAQTCPVCYGRSSRQPVCHLYAGTIHEAIRWATGKEHAVMESHCIAKGDPYCRFEIGDPA